MNRKQRNLKKIKQSNQAMKIARKNRAGHEWTWYKGISLYDRYEMTKAVARKILATVNIDFGKACAWNHEGSLSRIVKIAD